MSAPSNKRSGVGFRNCVVFPLNAANLPAATGTTAYEGFQAAGAKTLTINDPAYRVITHIGDDRAMQIDQLPATNGATAQLHLGRLDDDLEAAFSGLKAFVVGEMNMLLAGVTSQSGFEPTVGLLGYQQALDENGNRVWHSVMFPRCTVAKHESGFLDQPEDRLYDVVPALATAHIWGTAFATATEGAIQAQIVRAISQYKPALVAFLGDGATTDFLFPASRQAAATGKIKVWKNGTVVSAGLTLLTSKVTFSVAPALNDLVVVLYETP